MKAGNRKTVNFEKVKQIATDLLDIHQVEYFPIDLFELFEDYDNLNVISYQRMSEISGQSVEEIIKNCGSTEGALAYDPCTDQYILSYNNEVTRKRPREMIYWTLGHEFGHYILQHNREKNTGIIARVHLEEAKQDPYETEANFFARFFLSPPGIIAEANMLDKRKVRRYFGVSLTSASNTINYIQKSMRNGYRVVLPRELKQQFRKFIDHTTHGKTCVKCHSYFCLPHLKYCLVCGGKKFNKFIKGVDHIMKYDGFKTDNNSRAIECPRCKNEDLNYPGNICIVCNGLLVNKCGTGGEYDIQGNYFDIDSCETLLPGNARYCFQCGNPSTFYQANYLSAWNQDEIDEMQAKAQKESADYLPF